MESLFRDVPILNMTTINFVGRTWYVKNGSNMGPGPNAWRTENVGVDGEGLRLQIVQRDGQWTCAEVWLNTSLGFGRYEFEVTGRPDQFDRNITLGLFNYPNSPSIGPDGTNEIDIEFAQWGDPDNPNRLNWTVYPPALGPGSTSEVRLLRLNGSASTHRFDWSSAGVSYQSFHGYGDTYPLAEWNFAPSDSLQRVPQTPIPVHMNLWLFQGREPFNGQPVTVHIRDFRFTPRAE